MKPSPGASLSSSAEALSALRQPHALDPRPSLRIQSADGLSTRVENWVGTHGGWLWDLINGTPLLSYLANHLAIHRTVGKAPFRPLPLSTAHPYTSWEGLAERRHYARYLPENEDFAASLAAQGPSIGEVKRLFERHTPLDCPKSSCLFASFAQWFTDGFLRSVAGEPTRTRSSHQIDLSQVYGHTRAQQACLRMRPGRAQDRGKLKTEPQVIRGVVETFAPRLYDEQGHKRSEFQALLEPERLPPGLPVTQLHTLFAFGGERANVSVFTAALNTLFIRMHNRVCTAIGEAHPDWDDERVFQTSRNVMIALVIKIVIEEYVNHITPYHLEFKANPRVAWRAAWCRQNHIPFEFNLLYRWHALVPTTTAWGPHTLPSDRLIFDNQRLLGEGLLAVLKVASSQPAGALGLHNTAPFLLEVEAASLRQARAARLASYNDHRARFGFPRVTRFDQITGNPALAAELQRLYGEVDRVEFFVGLFAEDRLVNGALPPLMTRMVAVDAFSHALSNPLLAKNTFNEGSFSHTGMKILGGVRGLRDLFEPSASADEVTMTRPGWTRC